MPADKTSNYYATDVDVHDDLLKREIEKHYKKGPPRLIDDFNREDKAVADELGLLGTLFS